MTKGRDAHWPEPNVLTAVGMLHSELERQTEEKTNTAWQFCGQRASVSTKIYVLKASWGPGQAPWTQQLNSGLSCYLTDPVLTWNQHGHRQAAGIGFWWSLCSCCRRNTNSTMTLTATCSVVFIVWVFIQIYNGVAFMNNQMQFNRPTFQFWLIWLHPWLPWQQQVRFNTTGPRIIGGQQVLHERCVSLPCSQTIIERWSVIGLFQISFSTTSFFQASLLATVNLLISWKCNLLLLALICFFFLLNNCG